MSIETRSLSRAHQPMAIPVDESRIHRLNSTGARVHEPVIPQYLGFFPPLGHMKSFLQARFKPNLGESYSKMRKPSKKV